MGNWKNILLDTIKLTDEVRRLNGFTEKLSNHSIDMDKRLVRIETLIDVAKYQSNQKMIESD